MSCRIDSLQMKKMSLEIIVVFARVFDKTISVRMPVLDQAALSFFFFFFFFFF
jgi:hypothetical protein